MNSPEPEAARRFAIDVVRRLRDAGFEALWAGGCVRDQLLGRRPKDYDVATNAAPDQVRRVFGRRTLPLGAAFGVIAVLGGKQAGQVEVATFRRDAGYSDGRHPDSIAFSSAEEDAQRRDFTINGLFFDPLNSRTIDYVGGVDDLERRIVRAIGDPHQRFGEDKLRMLRAVRFTATFDFTIDPATLAAVRQHASELTVVSAERILQELRGMLVHENRRSAVELLVDSGLLAIIFPELDAVRIAGGPERWSRDLQILESLRQPGFAVALAALLRPLYLAEVEPAVRLSVGRLRLANEDTRTMLFCLANELSIRRARRTPWPILQRILTAPRSDALMDFATAVAEIEDAVLDNVTYCRDRLAMPPEQLDPPPLITGDDLKAAGLPPGRQYQTILTRIRDAQLEGRITEREAALQVARRIWQELAAEY